MKKYFSILLVLVCICTCLIPCNIVWAEGPDATIIFSDSYVEVGEEFTVTLRFQNTEANISKIEGALTYNPSIIEYIPNPESGLNGGGGNLPILEFATPSTDTLNVSLTFRAVSTGSTVLAVSCDVKDEADVSLGTAGASATLPVYNPTVALSSNANLASLSVSYGTLTPAFSASITSYTVMVENSVTKFPLSAKAEDANATIAITGSQVLEVGINQRLVTVTAQDGTQKTYTVTIVRAEPAQTATPEPTPTNTPDRPATTAPTQTPSQTQIPWDTMSPTQDTTPEISPSATTEVTVPPTQTVVPQPTATQDPGMTVDELKNTVLIVLVILAIIIIVILFTVVYCMQQKDQKKRGGKSSGSRSGNRSSASNSNRSRNSGSGSSKNSNRNRR